MRSWFTTILLLIVITACDSADSPGEQNDFAILAQPAEGFAQAQAGYQPVFPADHGAHPQYRIEWWYLTANLFDQDGSPYGAQWTLFRFALNPEANTGPAINIESSQLFMAHMAITTADGHVSFQRYAKAAGPGSNGRSGVKSRPFSAWLDDWVLQSTGDEWLPLEARARQDDSGFHLQLQSNKPLILQGVNGFSQKHPDGGGSYYYSQPFLEASGELILDGRKIAVSGNAWLDREWGSQFLRNDQTGWDWFSLHLDSGEKLMLFQLRNRQEPGDGRNYTHGVLIDPDGGKTELDPAMIRLKALEMSLVQGRNLPMKWQVDLPEISRQLTIQALHKEQWMEVDFPYWEGVVLLVGDSPETTGRGYMELTGYPVTSPHSP